MILVNKRDSVRKEIGKVSKKEKEYHLNKQKEESKQILSIAITYNCNLPNITSIVEKH